ncbi:MAG: hypothetical protein IAE66_00685 [Xanthomonadaceae bacterium]|nr:hypothetical protein [Xanthomonadaceae bacterium]
MSDQNDSLDTLVTASGTLAGISLALVGVLSAKNSLTKTETLADDFFLFSSIGFLIVLAMCYLAQKEKSVSGTAKTQKTAEWIFSISLILTLVAAFVLVYTEI